MYYCPTKLCSGERHFTNWFKETNECAIIAYSGTRFITNDFTSTKIVQWRKNTARRIWSRRIDNENFENTTNRIEKRLFWGTNGLFKFCYTASITCSRSNCSIRSIWHVSQRWICIVLILKIVNWGFKRNIKRIDDGSFDICLGQASFWSVGR